jgi:2-C-methyl-D-erythritol 2,4-cyclodiphosphate synthase
MMIVRTGLGRSSRRFLSEDSVKPCVIGGLVFEESAGLAADTDGDVVLHAIVHAIGTLVARPLMSELFKELFYKQGITDSQAYIEEALKMLGRQKMSHVALQIEAKQPHFDEYLPAMQAKVAHMLGLLPAQVGISVISGEGLSDVACGEGVSVTCIITSIESP